MFKALVNILLLSLLVAAGLQQTCAADETDQGQQQPSTSTQLGTEPSETTTPAVEPTVSEHPPGSEQTTTGHQPESNATAATTAKPECDENGELLDNCFLGAAIAFAIILIYLTVRICCFSSKPSEKPAQAKPAPHPAHKEQRKPAAVKSKAAVMAGANKGKGGGKKGK